MNIEQMMDINNIGSESQLSATGSVIGGAIGAYFGMPMVGSAIGGAIGGFTSKLIPQHTHIRGSVSGVNFVSLGLKPYGLLLTQPDPNTAKNISDYYCYFGCKTNRTEPLAIDSYMYKGHAYVSGDLEYNNTIPMDKFKVIATIFKRGVHIIE